MSQRSRLEDRYTVICKKCGAESIKPDKKPNQKYIAECNQCRGTKSAGRVTPKGTNVPPRYLSKNK